jgi:hypothetical protein
MLVLCLPSHHFNVIALSAFTESGVMRDNDKYCKVVYVGATEREIKRKNPLACVKKIRAAATVVGRLQKSRTGSL